METMYRRNGDRAMIFYHGTNQYGLDKANKQGFLLHERATKEFPNMDACTYLAVEKEEAKQYGDIILEVEYDPTINPDKNNYCKGCWQVRVYEPIYKFKLITKEQQ